MAEDEDILSVIKGDNRLVAKLGLTHAEVARPLLHVCNLMRALNFQTYWGSIIVTLCESSDQA